MNANNKCSYGIVNAKTGKVEPWSGTFKTPQQADGWYNSHGKKWESQGKELVRMAGYKHGRPKKRK